MKRQIRNNVFETNSSSVHTLVYLNQKLDKSKLKIDADGIIRIPIKYFGKNYKDYSSQEDKLSYIVTFFWCYFGEDISTFESNEWKTGYWIDIKKELIEYINKNKTSKRECIDIIPCLPHDLEYDDYYYKIAGFDHQMYPTGLDDCIVDLYNPEAVIQFIFNKNIILRTDCD